GAGQRPGGGRPGGGRGPRGGAAPAVPPGMYRVVLTVDGKEQAQPLRVDADPSAPAGPITADDDEEEGTGD
ncbi:MAG TPA: hypothetical protein VFA26_24425, partial [Gemmataceae bacterium]|nr:hypothetical protein [Gemmataceae bacterium]